MGQCGLQCGIDPSTCRSTVFEPSLSTTASSSVIEDSTAVSSSDAGGAAAPVRFVFGGTAVNFVRTSASILRSSEMARVPEPSWSKCWNSVISSALSPPRAALMCAPTS